MARLSKPPGRTIKLYITGDDPRSLRIVELLLRKHRPNAMMKSKHSFAIGMGGATIGDGLGVHALQFGGQFEHLARANRRQEFDRRRQAGDRAAFEVEGRHG